MCFYLYKGQTIELSYIICTCGSHKPIKQSKKIIKKVRIVVPCESKVGERDVLIGKQNQSECQLVDGQMGICFKGNGNIVSWSGYWLCGYQLHYYLVNDK